jgi:hypothetical protein
MRAVTSGSQAAHQYLQGVRPHTPVSRCRSFLELGLESNPRSHLEGTFRSPVSVLKGGGAQRGSLIEPTNCDNLHAPRDGGHGEATPLRSPTLPGYRMPGAEASASTAGNECVLKMQKPVSLTYHLLIRLGNRKVLRASTLFKKFFRQNPTRKCGLDA